MSEIKTKFGIGDQVCPISGVQTWAGGKRENLYFGRVTGIILKEMTDKSLRVIYKGEGMPDALEDELVLASEAKAYAIAWLAERLNVIANTEV